jgi:predicted ABC-type transport system involved in lysophospholipase L1 biosynthesis ATPase subunit
LENVQVPMFGVIHSPRQRQAKARELLELVGMSHRANHHPARMSVGERQRVALARALANDPPVLLADEPTGNLDSRTTDEILDLLAMLQRERELTMVIVTHSQEVADRADRQVRMRDGQIVEDPNAPITPAAHAGLTEAAR